MFRPEGHWRGVRGRVPVAATWRRLVVSTAVTLVLTSLSFPGVARAQDQALAEALFQEGQRLMSEQRFAEACDKFAESLRVDNSVGTLLNLAHCRESEGKLATAWALYSKGVNQARLAGQAERQTYAEQRAAELESRLPRLTITLEKAVDRSGVQVTLDEEPVSSSGYGFAFPVDPGTHQIVATEPGHEAWQAVVTFAARPPGQPGESKTVIVPLLRPAATATTVTPIGPTAATPPATTPAPVAAPAPAAATPTEPDGDEEPENQDVEARQRFRAVIYFGGGGHNTWSAPQGIGGPFAHFGVGVQKHFVPFLGFSARGGITIEALFIGSGAIIGPAEVGSATTVFFDSALIVGPIGPWFLGVGPWLGINTFLDSAGGPNTVIGGQALTGFMFGSRDQIQLTFRAQPGVWIDAAEHFRGLFEFGIAFP